MDQSTTQLYKCVTWTFINRKARNASPTMPPRTTQGRRPPDPDPCRPPQRDVYVGLGTQRMCSIDKKSVDGYPKAERKMANVVSFNSIYLDIDVGKKDAYATTDDAFAALDDFIDKVGLPEPSMEVLSGSGGLHVYWCLQDPMPVANWVPLATALRDAALAYGLKFDPQVTVNVAGILRVPDTLQPQERSRRPGSG